jgi:HlyD family secretion protein
MAKSRRVKKRWVVLGVMLAAMVAGGVWAGSPAGKKQIEAWKPKERPLEVRSEEVKLGRLVRSISAPGTIEPKTKVQISAQVLAKILALPFREGDSVKAGDVIVRLDGRDLAASLESAQAQLRQQEASLLGAEAELSLAKLNLERTRQLFPKDVTKADLERAEANALQADSRMKATQQVIAAAKAAITRAQKDLENTVITSPIDGTIIKLNAEVGETVVVGTLNNASSVIMEIADLRSMEMKARVDEANIAPVKADQPVKITTSAYRDRTFSGTVARVGLKKQIERDNTNFFEVEIDLKMPGDLVLGSGLTANADIEVESFAEILRVPSQAVVDRRQDELPKSVLESPAVNREKITARIVFVMEPAEAGKATKVQPRAVSTGASDLTHTVILGGLKAGERIVTGPFRALADLKEDLLVIEEGTKDADGKLIGRKAGQR